MKKTKVQLENELKSLQERVTDLECTTDSHSSKLSLIQEIISIMRELPVCRSLINRAVNRSKLRYLKQVVIPRRQSELVRLQFDKSMPESIKKKFTNDELKLIMTAQRAVCHREHFETKSMNIIKGTLIWFQQKLLKQRRVEHAQHK
jgi:hypothetical protein